MSQPKHYEVCWSPAAELDLDFIISYIAAQDGWSRAESILDKIQHHTDRLIAFPERGRLVPELHSQGITQYRELVSNPWRLLYKISGGVVFVLAVIDSRRNVEDILLERFACQTMK